MQLINPNVNIDFVGKRKIAVIFSLVLIAVGMVSLLIQGAPTTASTLPAEPWCRSNSLKTPAPNRSRMP